METLQHNPKIKQQIKGILYDFLYAPVQRRFQNQLNQLIIQNTLAGKFTHKSFIYKSELYTCDSTPAPRKMNRLFPQFHADMEAYIAEVTALNKTELPYVLGFINQTMNASNELHDYLRVFPPSIHGPIRHLIDTCTCRNKKMSEAEVAELLANNESARQLMMQRMAINLII